MSNLIGWLEDLSSRDTKARAILKRSLAFEPGAFPPAYAYVEPFVGTTASDWRRGTLYLVAGVWASHWREGRASSTMSLARAAAKHQSDSGSSSTERRFMNLLEADDEQLPHCLRQMVSLLKDYPIDFEALVSGLLHWNDDGKRTQIQWAREFYQSAQRPMSDDPTSTKGVGL